MGAAAGAWFAVATNVFLPDGVAGHVAGTSTLDEQELTLADSVEVPGGGVVHSAGNGVVFVGSFESPVYTRYQVGPDGSLTETGQLSFGNFGLTTGFNPNAVQFIAPDRAYIITDERVIVWDPAAMLITGEVAVPNLGRAGYTQGTGYTTFRRGTDLLWTLQWSSLGGDAILAETALVIFDTETQALDVTTLPGCGGAVWGAEDSDGAILWSSGAYDAAVYRLSGGARAAAPCLVRLESAATELSAGIVSLGSWTEGRLAGGLWGVSPGRATLRIFDDADYAISADTTAGDLTFRAPWSWHWLDLGTGQLTSIDSLGKNGGSVFTYQMGDRALVPAIPVTEDSTTLWDVTAGEGAPARSIFTPGNVYAAVRAR